jgi:hypothetical protein
MHRTGVFISYRREDTAGYARVIYDRLNSRYPGRVFMDVASIGAGLDFPAAIDSAVGESRLLVALIGKQWDTITGPGGIRRLDDPNDFVSREIAAALNKGLTVIPTLVPGASLPAADHLPARLAGLARRQAIQITDSDFDEDIERLISAIDRELGVSGFRVRLRRFGVPAVVAIAVLALAGIFVHSSRKSRPVAKENTASTALKSSTPPGPVGQASVPNESRTGPVPTAQQRDSKIQIAAPVRVHGMLVNDGWMISFDVPDRHPRDILYKFDNELEYKSTEVSQSVVDQVTGLPVPNRTIVVPSLTGPHIIDVKYTDMEGKEHGPFHTPFDPQHEVVSSTKEVMQLTAAWISFREYPEGRLIAYFTHLISYKNAFREIRYSVDNDSLSERVKFKPDWSRRGGPGIGPDDEISIVVPMTTKYIAVKLIYTDGTEAPLKKFTVSAMGVDR